MSVHHLAAAASLPDARPLYKLLLFTLSVHGDSHGRVRSSMGELMATSGMSERSVRNWLRVAEREKAIIREEGFAFRLTFDA
jgi:hypothetical protein